jgi:hypothetical protein
MDDMGRTPIDVASGTGRGAGDVLPLDVIALLKQATARN